MNSRREYRIKYSSSWTEGKSWGDEKYEITDPDHTTIGYAKTLWGAKRVVKKHKKTIGRPSGVVLTIPVVEGDVDAR